MSKKPSLFKRFKQAAMVSIIPHLVYIFLAILRRTFRIRHLNREGVDRLWEQGGNAIVLFWHGRLLAMPFCYARNRGKVLISRHRDGELITRVVKRFGIGAVRGSHRKEGALSSIREMIKEVEKGTDMAITPDGPKGPRYHMKQGIIELARLSGRPIVLLTYSASRRKVFDSWDKFMLPYPFSTILFLWGDPVYIGREVDAKAIEDKRQEMERNLIALTERADQLVCGV
jgi:lysophospholipid acyltransferase (LPLAT)-like uncharacterized protein